MNLLNIFKKKSIKKKPINFIKTVFPKTELWTILNDDETDYVWDKIYSDYKFHPSISSNIIPFEFNIPVDCYDINAPLIYNSDNFSVESIDDIFKSIFVECMEEDDYMYVLDWHHTCFKYNPRINKKIEYPVYMEDERYGGGGYNVYFPSFYPNGDYYFFIAKDFRWGYLTHPWQQKIWVFGNSLMKLIRKNSRVLGFIPLHTSNAD